MSIRFKYCFNLILIVVLILFGTSIFFSIHNNKKNLENINSYLLDKKIHLMPKDAHNIVYTFTSMPGSYEALWVKFKTTENFLKEISYSLKDKGVSKKTGVENIISPKGYFIPKWFVPNNYDCNMVYIDLNDQEKGRKLTAWRDKKSNIHYLEFIGFNYHKK